MTFLPIVDRELRVRARHSSTYKARGVGGLVAIAITCFLLLFSGVGSSPGSGIFSMLSFLAFGFCLFEGLRNTADCLSEEKRAGTLGFLFLTDLKGYDVVLGKMIAASLNSIYVLIAVLPAFALPLLVGGVTPGEFWRLVLVLIETLFFSLCVGMVVSAGSRNERHAWLASLGLVCFFAAVPPLIRATPFISAPWMEWLSPSIAFRYLREASYNVRPQIYWHAILGTAAMSGIFLVAAAYLLPRTWQDRSQRSARQPRKFLPQAADKRVLEENPVIWLTSRSGAQETYLWLLVGIFASFGALMWLVTMGWTVANFGFVFAALALHYIIAVWVAFNACYTLSEAKTSGAFELLFSTPLHPSEIVDGFLLGLKRQFFGPVVTLLSIEVALLVTKSVHLIVTEGGGLAGSLVLVIAASLIVMFVMDLYAAAIFGMWTALQAKKPSQAFTRTVVLVIVLPTLIGLCCFALPITGILKNMVFLSYKQALYDRFRRLVSDPRPIIGWDPSPESLPDKLSKPLDS
jgi:ABC-type transport system involved in multi-copper enzyme maturation permease subunit